MDDKQKKFIEVLTQARGLIAVSCKTMGISTTTFYKWKKDNPDFAAAVQEVGEVQKDFVESKLLENINNGDTTAIIFYLKTKAKDRGYGAMVVKSEKDKEIDRQKELVFDKQVLNKKNWLIKVLKKRGSYTPELSAQAKLTATLMVKLEKLSSQIAINGSVSVEVSREGNERQQVSAQEKLFITYAKQLQLALRALGMNTDSHTQIKNDDGGGIDGFLEALNNSVE